MGVGSIPTLVVVGTVERVEGSAEVDTKPNSPAIVEAIQSLIAIGGF
jgi:hypothetical protein